MRITSKAIGKAIFEATGYEDVNVFCKDGSCHFWSNNGHSIEYIYSGYTNAVTICRLSHQSIEQWVSDFIAIGEQD